MQLKSWVTRYIKFALAGLPSWLLGLAIYYVLFYVADLGIWAYLISSISGGIAQFSIIGACNKTKIGKMFYEK